MLNRGHVTGVRPKSDQRSCPSLLLAAGPSAPQAWCGGADQLEAPKRASSAKLPRNAETGRPGSPIMPSPYGKHLEGGRAKEASGEATAIHLDASLTSRQDLEVTSEPSFAADSASRNETAFG